MQAIRESGWACSTLYASDRGNGETPVLVDGSHRREALLRLLKSKDTSWLLRNETPDTFKVTVTVLKGLTPEEEGLVGREANHINSKHVAMTTVDHIIATDIAVTATRLRLNLKKGEALSAATLRSVHPDFQRYATPTIRAWKGLAEGLSPQAKKLIFRLHSSGLGPKGDVRVTLSKKTLMDSKMMVHLRKYPGAQFWYIQRLVALEADEKIRTNKAHYFENVILLLKGFSDACTQFALCLKHTFKLNKVAKYFDEIVRSGAAPEKLTKKLTPALKEHLKSFTRNYLWTFKREKEVQAVVDLRKKDYKMFPYVFYQLVAQLHFNEDYEKVDKMFAAPEANDRVKFTSPVDPTQENLNYRQLLQKRRLQLLSSRSGQSSNENDGPPTKKQKKQKKPAAEEARRKEKGKERERDQEQVENTDDDGDDEQVEEKDGRTPPAKEPKGKTKPSRDQDLPSKTSLSLDIYHSQSSTLASTVLQDINKLLEKTKVPPGQRITLKVHQNGKLAAERSFK